MDTRTFEAIKQKIAKMKEENIKASALTDDIRSRWKREFSINDDEECLKKLEEIEASIKEKKEAKQELLDKLETITDWGAI